MSRPREYDPKPVVTLYKQGLAESEVATRLNMPEPTVHSILEREGVRKRGQGGDQTSKTKKKDAPGR